MSNLSVKIFIHVINFATLMTPRVFVHFEIELPGNETSLYEKISVYTRRNITHAYF